MCSWLNHIKISFFVEDIKIFSDYMHKKNVYRLFFYNLLVVYDVQNVKTVNLAHGDTPRVNF